MDYPKFIVSHQKEEFISIQRVDFSGNQITQTRKTCASKIVADQEQSVLISLLASVLFLVDVYS